MKQEVDWLRVYRYFMREEGEEDCTSRRFWNGDCNVVREKRADIGDAPSILFQSHHPYHYSFWYILTLRGKWAERRWFIVYG